METPNLKELSDDALADHYEKTSKNLNRIMINSKTGLSKKYDEVNLHFSQIHDELVLRGMIELPPVPKPETKGSKNRKRGLKIFINVLMYVVLAGYIGMILIGFGGFFEKSASSSTNALSTRVRIRVAVILPLLFGFWIVGKSWGKYRSKE